MQRIEEMSKKCTDLAVKVEHQFQNVIDVSGELLEACVGTKGQHEEQKKVAEVRRAAFEVSLLHKLLFLVLRPYRNGKGSKNK